MSPASNETKTARWVDGSAIYGAGSVKLVTAKGATVARVRAPFHGQTSWYYVAGRATGGRCPSRERGVDACERWARRRGYTVENKASEVVECP